MDEFKNTCPNCRIYQSDIVRLVVEGSELKSKLAKAAFKFDRISLLLTPGMKAGVADAKATAIAGAEEARLPV